MEYLITYSWAFVIILTTIGALSYFGAFNPDKYIPNSCEFGEQMKCVDYFIGTDQDDTIVIVKFRNNFEQDIEITKVTGEKINLWEEGIVIKSGEIGRVNLTSIEKENIGQRIQYVLNISFKRNATDAKEHNLFGKLSSKVIDNNLGLV